MMYIIQTVIGLGISFLIYWGFLRREKSYGFNRFYLLGTMVLCLLIPGLEVEVPWTIPSISAISLDNTFATGHFVEENLEGDVVETITSGANTQETILWSLYLLGTLFLGIRLMRNLRQIFRFGDSYGPKVNGLQVILTKRETAPFSFFDRLVVNQQQFEHEGLDQSLIKHEQAHSQQWHSIDIILSEIIICFFWFNPLVWLYKKAITENHEYLADDFVVKEGVEIQAYADSIIQSIHKTYPPNLASGFSYVQIKNRLMMLNKAKSSRPLKAIKIACVCMLLGTSMVLSSFNYKYDKVPFVVLVDAGHGGKDEGAISNQLSEKGITLQVSKRLEALSKGTEVKIILVREKDEFLSLQERATYINAQKADMVISIHCNLSEKSSSNGVEAFHYQEGTYGEQSYDYSKILVSEQLKSVCDKGVIKTAGFFILKNSNCPSVLLELGYLNNEVDRKRLQDPKHQEAIAESIYRGLIKIKEKAL